MQFIICKVIFLAVSMAFEVRKTVILCLFVNIIRKILKEYELDDNMQL